MKTVGQAVVAVALFFTLYLASAQTVTVQRDAASSAVQREIDPDIALYIASVSAIDDHAHIVLPPPEDAADRNFDALPVDNMVPQTDPVAWRADNPQLSAAWKALWNFDGTAPLDATGMKQLQAARASVKARHAAGYDAWVLDQARAGAALANRVAMTPAIPPPRFRWVPYDDALLFPLDNRALAQTPDKALFFPLEAKVMARYLQERKLQRLPPTLDAYLAQVVMPTLEAQQKNGAVAVKFEVAYLRDFGFSNPRHDDAAWVYAKWVETRAAPDAAGYKLLQDYLFRAIAKQAGRLGMAVHLHTMSGGGGYFSIAGANPLLLEPLFNDPDLRGTNFVMLHGGWPFVHEVGSLLQKPNAYLDISQQSLTFPPRTLAGWLREWLETFPDKVLYGTDAYPYSDSMGWEESLWIADRNAREALGLALTGMVRDGEIDHARAENIAHDVLCGNAARLYHLTTP